MKWNYFSSKTTWDYKTSIPTSSSRESFKHILDIMERALFEKINALRIEAKDLSQHPLWDTIARPRIKTFKLAPGVRWPYHQHKGQYCDLLQIELRKKPHLLDVPNLVLATKLRPRLVKRAIQEIDDAIHWCYEARRKMERRWKKICEQEKEAVEYFLASQTLEVLKGGEEECSKDSGG